MSLKIVNLTLALMLKEFDLFAKDYPEEHPYKKALSLEYYRQKLIKKIINKIPNRFIIVDNNKSLDELENFLHVALEERLQIENEISKNLPDIIQKEKYQQREKPIDKIDRLHWWIKIDTLIPNSTYFVGPFDTVEKANLNQFNYIEDLMEEKAQIICFKIIKIKYL